MLRIAGSIACRSCSADWTFQPMNGYHGKEVCRLSFDSLCSVAHQRLFFINQCLDYWLLIWSRSASVCIFSSFSCPLDVYRCESLKSNKFYFLCDLFCLRSHFGHTPDLKQILLKEKKYLRFVLRIKALTGALVTGVRQYEDTEAEPMEPSTR